MRPCVGRAVTPLGWPPGATASTPFPTGHIVATLGERTRVLVAGGEAGARRA
jgi:hypothetical protein